MDVHGNTLKWMSITWIITCSIIHDVIRDVERKKEKKKERKKERKIPEAMEKWKMRVASGGIQTHDTQYSRQMLYQMHVHVCRVVKDIDDSKKVMHNN